ncbi:tyrosine-type recombinase/integrase [Flavobacterium okayamense]|uniref:Integrase n=1 Tax=Flavobacterium okayamense TaxID=2830782 RepID=A0ABN6HYH5_9FLAO|nr:integrase [Flavobacterium okayamense]
MIDIKRNVIFSLENRKKNGVPVVENVPIRMRVIFMGNRVDFSTGFRIDTSKWDEKKQRVKNGCTNKLKQSSSDINTKLQEYENNIQNIFKIFETQDINPTTELLKTEFKNLFKDDNEKEKSSKKGFLKVFDEFTKESGRQNDWTYSTFEKFASVKNHLIKFSTKLSFDLFDEKGLNDYVIFLRDVEQMRNSTIGKQIGFLKWFLRWSKQKGYNKNLAFETFKPKLKSTPKKVIFLTPKELKKLREYKLPETKQYLERVRDVFIFCCYSSLRYSDVNNLRRSNVKKNHIEVTTVKTADNLLIDLNNYSREILDKYKDIHFEDDRALPVISNQKMNDYIKELAELAGIDEPVHETYYKGNKRIDTITPKYALLSTHAGRRTFICYALSIGIPVQIVMKWTGHSDYKAMKPYIDVVDELKASEMQKFNLL